jgi:hypothetical protein
MVLAVDCHPDDKSHKGCVMSERILPHPTDDRDRKLLADIARVGWAVIGINAEEEGPAYAFSVGLFHTFSAPELLIMGLRIPTAMHLINDIGASIRTGRRFEAGGRYEDIAEGFPVEFTAVMKRHYRDYLGYAQWFYQGVEFPVLQCVWPDKKGVFPWEPGYDTGCFWFQRLLGPAGTFADGWLFPDPPNVTTFTLRQIVKEGQPILYVVHDNDDGAWQFLSGDPCQVADGMVVSLAGMIRRDPSLVELANLPVGWQAHRPEIGKPWQREPMQPQKDE